MQTLKNRLAKLEKNRPATDFVYQISATILMEDDATDEEILAKQLSNPKHRYIRFSDFVEECV